MSAPLAGKDTHGWRGGKQNFRADDEAIAMAGI
jgi:hypothetical protein